MTMEHQQHDQQHQQRHHHHHHHQHQYQYQQPQVNNNRNVCNQKGAVLDASTRTDDEADDDCADMELAIHSCATSSSEKASTILPSPFSIERNPSQREESRKSNAISRTSAIRVTLIHSEAYTRVLHDAMGHIHQDRDILLGELLYYCGFLRNTPKFLSIVSPKRATRAHLERFHHSYYLDLLCPHYFPAEDPNKLDELESLVLPSLSVSSQTQELLESMGLIEDCALPNSLAGRRALWNYCKYVAGASLQAAHLLINDDDDDDDDVKIHNASTANKKKGTDVVIHWGGGRHHAHPNKASGFCFINDICLAIQYMVKHGVQRVLYVDIDIHHADGVQQAFYEQDNVMTVSFHRYSPGFFPAASGCPGEKGKHNTKGVGYNLNLSVPVGVENEDFLFLFKYTLENLLVSYDPKVVVLCVGADGLKGDPLVAETDDGWNLSREALAECVRFASMLCSGNRRSASDNCDGESEEIFNGEKGRSKSTNGQQKQEHNKQMKDDSTAGPQIPKHKSDYSKNKSIKRKLLVLGGGGYNAAETARAYLLCTAAACEGARPGMLWKELPQDVPHHDHFPRYRPDFLLYSPDWATPTATTSTGTCQNMTKDSGDVCRHYQDMLLQAKKAVDLGATYILSRRNKQVYATPNFLALEKEDDPVLSSLWRRKTNPKKMGGSNTSGISPENTTKRSQRRKRKKRKAVQAKTTETIATSAL